MYYFISAATAGRNYRVILSLNDVTLKMVGSCWSLNSKTVKIADAANIQRVGRGQRFQRPLPAIRQSIGCTQNNVTTLL